MATPFVLDASLTLSWCFPSESTPYSRSVLASFETTYAIVPALWPFEVANVLAIAERRGRVTSEARDEFLAELHELSIQIERRETLWLWQQILPLAQAHGLSAYDAAYLDLAKREKLSLATLDEDLRRAALAEQVPLAKGA